jgi:hypothetical protein
VFEVAPEEPTHFYSLTHSLTHSSDWLAGWLAGWLRIKGLNKKPLPLRQYYNVPPWHLCVFFLVSLEKFPAKSVTLPCQRLRLPVGLTDFDKRCPRAICAKPNDVLKEPEDDNRFRRPILLTKPKDALFGYKSKRCPCL